MLNRDCAVFSLLSKVDMASLGDDSELNDAAHERRFRVTLRSSAKTDLLTCEETDSTIIPSKMNENNESSGRVAKNRLLCYLPLVLGIMRS